MLNGKSGLLFPISPQKGQEISEREKKDLFRLLFFLPQLCTFTVLLSSEKRENGKKYLFTLRGGGGGNVVYSVAVIVSFLRSSTPFAFVLSQEN